MTINEVVQTPNGPGRVVSTYYLGDEEPEAPPTGILIRHPRGVDIDLAKCAAKASETSTSGWLVVYHKSQVTPTR